MDVSKSISILEAITPVVKAIPIAGTGLTVMLEVAAQVCRAVEVRLHMFGLVLLSVSTQLTQTCNRT